MRGRILVATLTLVAFTTLVIWPHGAWAADASKPADGKAAEAAPAPAPAPAATDDASMGQAKQHFETGRNAYNAGDYVTAIREFKAAEALRPSPILDYNIGLANEKLGKRRVAVKYYRRYLDAQPNASNKAEVEGRISTLEAEIAAAPPPAAQTTPGGTAGGQAQAQEQPGDMPPIDPAAAQAQPGYDPYSSQPPPGQPIAKPAKKKSYWWIGLIIAGAASLTIAVIVVAYVYAANTTIYAADHGLTLPRIDHSHDLNGLTLFRF